MSRESNLGPIVINYNGDIGGETGLGGRQLHRVGQNNRTEDSAGGTFRNERGQARQKPPKKKSGNPANQGQKSSKKMKKKTRNNDLPVRVGYKLTKALKLPKKRGKHQRGGKGCIQEKIIFAPWK